MQQFAALYSELDRSNRSSDKLEALRQYFRAADPQDAIWAVYLLAGKKIGRTITTTQLRQWVSEVSGYPEWMINECYSVVGDLSETLSLLIPYEKPDAQPPNLKVIVEERLKPLGKMPPDKQRELVIQTWRELSPQQRLVFHKLISGTYRVGVSRQSLILALADVANVPASVMAHRLSGNISPDAATMQRILRPAGDDERIDASLPYPFMLAHPLAAGTETLANITDWQIEWKWDGIRAQLIRRQGKTAVWSRGDELISGAFPELLHIGSELPDGTVIDGEILAWDDRATRPRTFATLQRRLNRKNVELSLWPDVVVKLVAFDLLEWAGEDLRGKPLSERRRLLGELLQNRSDSTLRISEPIATDSWESLTALMKESRQRGVEGVMLKRLDSTYEAGRPTGLWWKLKVDPYTVDAVLIAAQPGTGRRAGLLTDYTFGVWNDGHGELVPVAKAYSGLTDAEITEMDRFVRNHTTGRFGPVYAVEPTRVIELGFEAIQKSDRHKSGIALRFPRILRMRTDKTVNEADTLQSLRELLARCEEVR